MTKFSTMTVVMVTPPYVFAVIHQIVPVKLARFLASELNLDERTREEEEGGLGSRASPTTVFLTQATALL